MGFDERITETAERIERDRANTVAAAEARADQVTAWGLKLRQARRDVLRLSGLLYEGLQEKGVPEDIEAVERRRYSTRRLKDGLRTKWHTGETVLASGWVLRVNAHERGLPTFFHGGWTGDASYGSMISGGGELLKFAIPPVRGFSSNPYGSRSDEIGRFPSADDNIRSPQVTRVAVGPRPYHNGDRELGVFRNLYPTSDDKRYEEWLEDLYASNAPGTRLESEEMLSAETRILQGLLSTAAIYGVRVDHLAED